MTVVETFRTAERPITMLTAYDAPTARLVETAGVDAILVGDSVATTALGHDTTLPVTGRQMRDHVAAVCRGVDTIPVIADVPFLSVGVERAESVRNCGRMLKETDADAVKIESGPHTVELTERLVDLGVPVMAHLGLTPQRVRQTGYRQQATDSDAAARMCDLAQAHADAGAFAVVLEHVPAEAAAEVTEAVDVPTIGIGAGPACDGQILVFHDVVGLSERTPPFAEAFGDVAGAVTDAVAEYVAAVETGRFPSGTGDDDDGDVGEDRS